MDKYSTYGECPNCGSLYMNTNPMVECKDMNGNIVRVCMNCYETKFKNKFGNTDKCEDVFVN